MAKATVIVHWPGKDTLACNEHAAQLQRLAGVFGIGVSQSAIESDEECKNCENEAKKRKQHSGG